MGNQTLISKGFLGHVGVSTKERAIAAGYLADQLEKLMAMRQQKRLRPNYIPEESAEDKALQLAPDARYVFREITGADLRKLLGQLGVTAWHGQVHYNRAKDYSPFNVKNAPSKASTIEGWIQYNWAFDPTGRNINERLQRMHAHSLQWQPAIEDQTPSAVSFFATKNVEEVARTLHSHAYRVAPGRVEILHH